MCGPIAMMLPVDRSNPAKKVTQILSYHLGRISAYAVIGFVFGLLGKGFFMAGMQQRLSIFIGVLMIVAIIIPEKTFAQYNFSKPVFRLISKVKQALGNQFKKKSYQSLFTIGLLNGFLPCGMVYVALFGAIAMQSISLGILYMVLFGLGTVPLMSTVVYINSFLTVSIRNKIQKAIPYVSPATMSLFVQANPNCH
jgi:sulfite exporter TauE/SafE